MLPCLHPHPRKEEEGHPGARRQPGRGVTCAGAREMPPRGAAAGLSPRGGVVPAGPGASRCSPGPALGTRGQRRRPPAGRGGTGRCGPPRGALPAGGSGPARGTGGSAFRARSLRLLPGRAHAAPRPPRPRGLPLAAPPGLSCPVPLHPGPWGRRPPGATERYLRCRRRGPAGSPRPLPLRQRRAGRPGTAARQPRACARPSRARHTVPAADAGGLRSPWPEPGEPGRQPALPAPAPARRGGLPPGRSRRGDRRGPLRLRGGLRWEQPPQLPQGGGGWGGRGGSHGAGAEGGTPGKPA